MSEKFYVFKTWTHLIISFVDFTLNKFIHRTYKRIKGNDIDPDGPLNHSVYHLVHHADTYYFLKNSVATLYLLVIKHIYC